MGVCASSQLYTTTNNNKAIGWPIIISRVQIIHSLDGKLEEFNHEVRASQVLSRYPSCFLCSSESMLVGAPALQLAPADPLRPGQIYFLLPLSSAYSPLSLQRLCSLAVTASAALSAADQFPITTTTSCGPLPRSLPILPKA